jgi:hypothetical protein
MFEFDLTGLFSLQMLPTTDVPPRRAASASHAAHYCSSSSLYRNLE